MPRMKRSEYELSRQEQLKRETAIRRSDKKLIAERKEEARRKRQLAQASNFSVSQDIPKIVDATNTITPREAHQRVAANAFARARAKQYKGIRHWNHRYYATFSGLAELFEGDKGKIVNVRRRCNRLIEKGEVSEPKPHRFPNQVPSEKYFEILPEFVEAMGWDMNTLHEWKKAQDDNA